MAARTCELVLGMSHVSTQFHSTYIPDVVAAATRAGLAWERITAEGTVVLTFGGTLAACERLVASHQAHGHTARVLSETP